ncbi:MAG: NADPH-dependent glutamate synthase [Peptostreptococcaceae bacterium]|nr:NADPH-dependent glutamate synthase [Peptostreptococcaceae bacterium]
MINFVENKNPMPSQDPNVRNKNFVEVTSGYTDKMAINEAMRCLQCRDKPCTGGCPVLVKIPEFIAQVAKGEFEEAFQIIGTTNSLPAVCGRVCPQENQCEGECVRGKDGEPVAIGRLERFVADWHRDHFGDIKDQPTKANGHKAAIVGSGPAGLACAGDLIVEGYDVTVFESLHKEGGVLAYGIPEFRLPKSIVQMEVDKLADKGVKFVKDAVVGKIFSVDELLNEGYESVFVGTGAGLPRFMNMPGENLLGVYSANEYLTRINLMKAYKAEYDTPIKVNKNVAVIGGGNVAMDSARCAKRMGAENVYIVYRRSMDEIPARKEEIEHAIEEGIIFKLLNNPVQVIGDDKKYVTGLECVEMELGEPDASGRRRPIEKKGSNFVLDVDAVIVSIGTNLNKLILETTENLEANKNGGIGASDDDGVTSNPAVFAGGDAVTGAATVILAMGAGKKAAAGMISYMENK